MRSILVLKEIKRCDHSSARGLRSPVKTKRRHFDEKNGIPLFSRSLADCCSWTVVHWCLPAADCCSSTFVLAGFAVRLMRRLAYAATSKPLIGDQTITRV
jgi:hypothetical protein